MEEGHEDKHQLTDVQRESDDIIIQYLLDGDLEGICRPLKVSFCQRYAFLNIYLYTVHQTK